MPKRVSHDQNARSLVHTENCNRNGKGDRIALLSLLRKNTQLRYQCHCEQVDKDKQASRVSGSCRRETLWSVAEAAQPQQCACAANGPSSLQRYARSLFYRPRAIHGAQHHRAYSSLVLWPTYLREPSVVHASTNYDQVVGTKHTVQQSHLSSSPQYEHRAQST